MLTTALAADAPHRSNGTLPTDAKGRPLNLDFESGTLRDWQAEGDAFGRQPIEGDTVHARRGDMHSGHAGRYWVGTYERQGDAPQGTLTSVPFTVTHPFASFLVAGGPHVETCVELLRVDTQQVIFRATGDETEDLKPVLANLSGQLGREIAIRLVDRHSGGWGHINFDDFRFHDAKLDFPPRPGAQPLDAYQHAGLDAEAAAKAMTVPEGFRATLFAGEPDVVQPIAQAIDDRGRLWVAEAYSYPFHVPEEEARDRILIFEDTDGDGRFDHRKVFCDHLNLVSGLEVGFGGAWVGMAPYLVFIPDRDGDDVPDGEAQVLLNGWGFEDTHETLNTFVWGPDGWLYGCHGVFTHSLVGKPGTPDDERVPINAGIWRYHPKKHRFEVFAQGTSNPWGLDFNDQGQAFCTACVIPHLFHVIQAARYQRQAGGHFNPYTYDDIQTIAVHRHWIGATPHSGNNRSDAAGGGHAHAGAMIYLGGNWPAEYRNQIFMNNIHGARLNMDLLAPRGSGYVGDRAPDFLRANDSWSQIINLQYGPDGQMYLIDWYDKNQCHHGDPNGHDRTNGRIFKVSYENSRHVAIDVAKKSDAELVQMQLATNDWLVRHARRVLQERGPNPKTHAELAKLAFEHADETRRLRALWALHVCGGLNQKRVDLGLVNDSALVRAWTIQLALEDKAITPKLLATLLDLARRDPSPVVRLYLASALDRLPPADRGEILRGLLAHAEDAGDHNLPLMYWYGAEPLAEQNPEFALSLAETSRITLVDRFLVRRLAALGTPEAMHLLVDRLARTGDPGKLLDLLRQINEGLQGKRQLPMPDGWRPIYDFAVESGDDALRSQATALALTFGDPVAFKAMERRLGDQEVGVALREEALVALVKARDPGLPPILRGLLTDASLRRPALRGLAAFDDPRTPGAILEGYAGFNLDEKRDALATLAARVEYGKALLDAIADKRLPPTDLSADCIRQLRNLKNDQLDARIAEVWGAVNDTPEERLKLIAHYKAIFNKPPAQALNLALGRTLFAKTCQPCHTLFGTGGKVGPELTGSNRANLDYLLANLLDPSALIGKDYQATVIQTDDGRTLTGIVRGETDDAVTLATANETLVIPKSEIEVRELSAKSMMPDDQLKPFGEHELRSLVAYLASPSQTPLLATAESASEFFNGRDLAGWQGNADLWRVDNGELVGRSEGLDHNEFLRSELAAGDFHLALDVKLVKNEGNSGIQFRSEAVGGGEVKGYQADIGPGWWGKLYEEQGRALLWDRSGEAHVKPGEWNHYEIVAVSSRIRTSINGKPCVELDDPDGARGGIFAFQLHSGGPTEVRFKAIKLELIPVPDEAAKAGE
jgi:putative membrane-bound dehydrogenase-like protein